MQKFVLALTLGCLLWLTGAPVSAQHGYYPGYQGYNGGYYTQARYYYYQPVYPIYQPYYAAPLTHCPPGTPSALSTDPKDQLIRELLQRLGGQPGSQPGGPQAMKAPPAQPPLSADEISALRKLLRTPDK